MEFYQLVKTQDITFKKFLMAYEELIRITLDFCDNNKETIVSLYMELKENKSAYKKIMSDIVLFVKKLSDVIFSSKCKKIILNRKIFDMTVSNNLYDKMLRTIKNESKIAFDTKDLEENLFTGIMSGVYIFFRGIYNDVLLKRNISLKKEHIIANYFFVREYCYGSMFRYNSNGEFNIPYGGMSYNRKNFKSKIDYIFSEENMALFKGANIYSLDFEDFLSKICVGKNDFIFLDPPYDTNFSNYEGRVFDKKDHERLARTVSQIDANVLLVIKNTEFIYNLYKEDFSITAFDKTYAYNVRERNERKAEHLIITNIKTIT